MWSAFSILCAVALIPACFADVDPKIMGGVVTGKGKFPFVVWVEFDGEMICSGALLNQDYILTVASCLPERERWNSTRFRVVLGDYRRKRDVAVSIIPKRIIPHPDFGKYNDLNNNIALIQLSTPAPVDRQSIEPVQRLSTSNRVNQIIASKASKCVAVGWGYEKRENGVIYDVNVMQKLNIFFAEDSDCISSGYQNGEHICYKSTTGTSCYGDEGLVVSCLWRKKWTLVGLQSLGSCNGGVMIGTKVSTYRKWINAVIKDKENALGLQLGEACRVTGQCLRNFTVCDGGRCACAIGYQPHNGMCYLERALREECQVSAQCNGMNEMCRYSLCSCKRNALEVEGKCFLKARLGDVCVQSEQCLDANQECNNYKCACAVDSVEFEKRCIPQRKLTQECNVNAQCTDSRQACIRRVCACVPGWVSNNGVCYKDKQLTERCIVNEQCVDGHQECDGVCVCVRGWKPYNNICFQEKAIGATCDISEQCSGDNQVCSTNRCRCSPDAVRVAGTCVARRKPGQSCQYSAQCGHRQGCKDGICYCYDGMGYYGNKCLEYQSYGGKCLYNVQCNGPHQECDSFHCKCEAYYAYRDRSCIRVFVPDTPCTNATACTSVGSVCGYDGTCTCAPGYIEMNTVFGVGCLLRMKNGEPCIENDQCPTKRCTGAVCKLY